MSAGAILEGLVKGPRFYKRKIVQTLFQTRMDFSKKQIQ